jgi:hypothetical protein
MYICPYVDFCNTYSRNVGYRTRFTELESGGLNEIRRFSGFGGLEVACWPLVPKLAVSHPAEAV